jgi:hypothetical protein
MVKDKVYFDPAKKAFMINGVPYRFAYEKKGSAGKGHAGNAVFKPQEPDHEEKLGRIADYLAKNCNITVKMVIQEALRNAPPRELIKIEKSIKRRAKPKVRHGCLALEIGGQPIYIVP